MKFYSLNNPAGSSFSLEEAINHSLAPDGGLIMPQSIPKLEDAVVGAFATMDFGKVSLAMLKPFLCPDIPEAKLDLMIRQAFDFDAPVKKIGEHYVLELFHGPSAAFKDFGVRLMAELLLQFKKASGDVTILTATSGDTGGAVASAFWKRPGFRVVILYPHGKISAIQEAQIATLGENITALAIDGNFDDCQKLVKTIFADKQLSANCNLCSANSISIARLLPQICYYGRAYSQLGTPFSVSVPSGNFGNVTAAAIAKQMGLPIKKIIATTNANDIVPRYFRTGKYERLPFVETLTNAMDIADPSNFARLFALYNNNLETIRSEVLAYSVSDHQVRHTIKETYAKNGYLLDPHGAAGLIGLQQAERAERNLGKLLFLETASPFKFPESIDSIVPGALKDSPLNSLLSRKNLSKRVKPDLEAIKSDLVGPYLR